MKIKLTNLFNVKENQKFWIMRKIKNKMIVKYQCYVYDNELFIEDQPAFIDLRYIINNFEMYLYDPEEEE